LGQKVIAGEKEKTFEEIKVKKVLGWMFPN